jgi:hypothetical protein
MKQKVITVNGIQYRLEQFDTNSVNVINANGNAIIELHGVTIQNDLKLIKENINEIGNAVQKLVEEPTEENAIRLRNFIDQASPTWKEELSAQMNSKLTELTPKVKRGFGFRRNGIQNGDSRSGAAILCGELTAEGDSVRIHEPESQHARLGTRLL